MRAVVNSFMYVPSTGCQWRSIPKDLAARSTVHDDFDLWDYDGTLERIHHTLYVACRERVGREVITHACDGADQAPIVSRMVANGLAPLRRAASMTVRMSASPAAAHIAR